MHYHILDMVLRSLGQNFKIPKFFFYFRKWTPIVGVSCNALCEPRKRKHMCHFEQLHNSSSFPHLCVLFEQWYGQPFLFPLFWGLTKGFSENNENSGLFGENLRVVRGHLWNVIIQWWLIVKDIINVDGMLCEKMAIICRHMSSCTYNTSYMVLQVGLIRFMA